MVRSLHLFLLAVFVLAPSPALSAPRRQLHGRRRRDLKGDKELDKKVVYVPVVVTTPVTVGGKASAKFPKSLKGLKDPKSKKSKKGGGGGMSAKATKSPSPAPTSFDTPVPVVIIGNTTTTTTTAQGRGGHERAGGGGARARGMTMKPMTMMMSDRKQRLLRDLVAAKMEDEEEELIRTLRRQGTGAGPQLRQLPVPSLREEESHFF